MQSGFFCETEVAFRFFLSNKKQKNWQVFKKHVIIQGFADHGEAEESEAKAEQKGSLKTYSR